MKKRNKYLDCEWTIASLTAESERLSRDPRNRNITPYSFNRYNKATMKKLDDISWAITFLLKKERGIVI